MFHHNNPFDYVFPHNPMNPTDPCGPMSPNPYTPFNKDIDEWLNAIDSIAKKVDAVGISKEVVKDGKVITYKNGIVHKENGPAIVYQDEETLAEYYLEGVRYSESDYNAELSKREDEKVHVIVIEGEEYEVTGKQLKDFGFKKKEK